LNMRENNGKQCVFCS